MEQIRRKVHKTIEGIRKPVLVLEDQIVELTRQYEEEKHVLEDQIHELTRNNDWKLGELLNKLLAIDSSEIHYIVPYDIENEDIEELILNEEFGIWWLFDVDLPEDHQLADAFKALTSMFLYQAHTVEYQLSGQKRGYKGRDTYFEEIGPRQYDVQNYDDDYFVNEDDTDRFEFYGIQDLCIVEVDVDWGDWDSQYVTTDRKETMISIRLKPQAMFSEIKGNLFETSDNLAHCVSADFHMGAGIAKTFKQCFGHQQQLMTSGVKVGKCAVLNVPFNGQYRYIFYLVTKERYFQKPTYESMKAALQSMKKYCDKHNITSISMPRIGCGLDGLDWGQVRQIIENELQHLRVTVCYL